MKYPLIFSICCFSLIVFSQTEIELRTDGIVVPRLDTTNVSSPSIGQVIYDTLTAQLMYYNGTNWMSLNGAFERNWTTVRQKGGYDTDDFVFGRNDLPPDTTITGKLFFFDKSKGAFRGGSTAVEPHWAPDSLGSNSFGYGYQVKASGEFGASAIGYQTRAIGKWGASAIGYQTRASGDIGATALGRLTRATGNDGASALGHESEAAGDNGAIALGWFTKANGRGMTVVGHYNDPIVSEGADTASTNPVFIVGNGDDIVERSNALVVLRNGEISFENYSFPIADGSSNQNLSTDGNGQLSWTTGNGAFEKSGSLVRQLTDVDTDDFIFGRATLPPAGNITDKFFFYDQLTSSFRGGILSNSNNWNVRGASSFGYGENVAPSGDQSAAFGLSTQAVGDNSFAIGEETKAEAAHSVAIGRFNVGGGNAASWTSTDPLFEIGIGTSDVARKNAVTVLKNGKVGIGVSVPGSQVHQSYNSSSGDAHLKLTEEGADGARIILENDQNDNRWTIFGQPFTTAASSKVNIHYNDVSGGGTETGNKFQIFGDGDATLEGTLTQNSDRRLKKKIVRLENALALILAINGYSYQWKNDQINTKKQIGVIAQEVQEVLPEIVKTSEEGTLSVSYTSLVPLLIEGMKEQQEMIESVLKENSKLKNEIAEIKAFLKM